MIAFCNSSTDTGYPCGYPPPACPIHTPVSPAAPATTPGEHPAEKFDHDSLRPIAESVIAKLASGALTPLEAVRWLRALHSFHDLPVSPMDEEEAWKEVEFRGRIMHGQPPRDADEWAYAERIYDDEAIAEFRRWDAELRGGGGLAGSDRSEDEDYAS